MDSRLQALVLILVAKLHHESSEEIASLAKTLFPTCDVDKLLKVVERLTQSSNKQKLNDIIIRLNLELELLLFG